MGRLIKVIDPLISPTCLPQNHSFSSKIFFFCNANPSLRAPPDSYFIIKVQNLPFSFVVVASLKTLYYLTCEIFIQLAVLLVSSQARKYGFDQRLLVLHLGVSRNQYNTHLLSLSGDYLLAFSLFLLEIYWFHNIKLHPLVKF